MQNSIDPKEAMSTMAKMIEQLEAELAQPGAVSEKQRPKIERQLLSVKKTIARLDPTGAGAPYLQLLAAATQRKLLANSARTARQG